MSCRLFSSSRASLLQRCFLACALLALVFLSAALFATPAYALLYDSGSYSNEYASQEANKATTSIGKADSSVFETSVVDGEEVIKTTAAKLISAESYLDGARVSITGEAIGDMLNADNGHVWVNLESDGGLIGVYMTDEQSEKIAYLGRYGTKGSILEVVGTFNIACEEHGGDLEVHANKVEVVSPGGELVDSFRQDKLFFGLSFVAVGVALIITYRRLRKAAL